MNVIRLENITKRFGDRTIFQDFNLDIEKGEFLGIRGESGSGKSTLLNIIGLLEECEGTIRVEGREIDRKNDKQVRKLLREEIGYLFQNFALIDDRTVYDNLKLVLRKAPKAEERRLMLDALKRTGLGDVLDKTVYQLSGGEQQRVAVARLILHKCSIVLADEPTGSLDQENAEIIIQLLHEFHKKGCTVIMVSHDPNAFRHCTRVINIGTNS